MKKARKILTMALCAVLLVCISVGATVAYLTANVDMVKNTFTVGAITITLDENEVEQDANDNYIEKGTNRVTENKYDLHPGIVAAKDPTVHVKGGSEDCYVVAKIEVGATDMAALRAQLGYDGSNGLIGISEVVSGGVLSATYAAPTVNAAGATEWENDYYILTQKVVGDKNVFYVYFKTEQKEQATDADLVIFEQIAIPADWSTDELAALAGLTIDVDAFAVQADGFTDVVAAFAAAFANEHAVTAPTIG